jgi:hypothetical protein
VTGTNIKDVKRKNEHSGLTYKELNELFDKTTIGLSKGINTDTKIDHSK